MWPLRSDAISASVPLRRLLAPDFPVQGARAPRETSTPGSAPSRPRPRAHSLELSESDYLHDAVHLLHRAVAAELVPELMKGRDVPRRPAPLRRLAASRERAIRSARHDTRAVGVKAERPTPVDATGAPRPW